VIQHKLRYIGYPRDMPEDFVHTNRRPSDQVRDPYFHTSHELPKEQVEGCWYHSLFDDKDESWSENWREFLGEVYDLCDQRMFYIESTPCWPSHPDIVMEFLSIIRAYEAFQNKTVWEQKPDYGLDLCEKIDKSFERIKKMLDRCSSECHYARQRRVDDEWEGRTTPVKDLSRVILPGVFEQLSIFSNQVHQNESKPIQGGDAR
jgi:hypothetical protein